MFQWEVKGIFFCEYYNKFLVMSSLHRLLLSSSTNHTKVECSGLEKHISDCLMSDEYGPAACDGGQALVMCTDSECTGNINQSIVDIVYSIDIVDIYR